MMTSEPYSGPEILHHYCGAAALRSIVLEGKIRASSIEFMNDARELSEGLDVFTKMMAARASSCDEHVQQTLALFAKRLPGLFTTPDGERYWNSTYCAFSLTEDGDQFSQWRAYCPPEGGFSIAFSADELIQRTGWTLAECCYSPADQEQLLAPILDKFITLLTEAPCVRIVVA